MGIIKSLSSNKFAVNSVNTDDLLIEITEELRLKLQATILEMLLDLLSVCQKYDLQLTLVGGSALGAVRHKGFIPWDDDLDVAIPRKDYEQLKRVFEHELSSKYILDAPNYTSRCKSRFAKMLKKDTVLQEVIDVKKIEQCKVFLDIFVLDNVPESKIKRKIKGTVCNALEFISGQVQLVENMDSTLKELLKRSGGKSYYVRMFVGRVFSLCHSSKWFDLIDKIIQDKNDKSTFLTIATGRKHYFGEIIQRDKLFPLVEGEFEGHKVPVFLNEDYYLSNLYGDYMKIPPVEKREKHFIRKISL